MFYFSRLICLIFILKFYPHIRKRQNVDGDLCEAIKATGASKFQVIVYGVMPQVLPHFIDYTLYRWEYNFRASSIVGLIGAGGLGFQLIAPLRIMQYQEVSAILLVILLMVTLVDTFSSTLRKRFK